MSERNSILLNYNLINQIFHGQERGAKVRNPHCVYIFPIKIQMKNENVISIMDMLM